MGLQQPLIASIKSIISEDRAQAYRQTITVLLRMYWDIGRLIVEDERNEKKRAYAEFRVNALTQPSPRGGGLQKYLIFFALAPSLFGRRRG